MEKNDKSRKRFDNIDLMKAIGIIMVIALHVHLFEVNFIKSNSVGVIVQFAFRIICEGVPIFVLVNGFLLINKEKFNLKVHLVKTGKIFILLILWSGIITVISQIIWKEELAINSIVNNILTTSIKNKYTGMLWFLQNLIVLYLMYPIIKSLHDSNKKLYNYFFIVLLISTVGINFLAMISNLIITMLKFKYIQSIIQYLNKFQITTNAYFLLFFMLGGYLFEKKEKFENKKVTIKWMIIGGLSWLFAFLYGFIISILQKRTCSESFNYYTIFMFLLLVSLFAITYKYHNKGKFLNKIIESIGKNSLGIYLIHALIIRILNQFIKGDVFWIKIMNMILVLFISLVVTVLIRRIPKINKIIEI